MAKRPPLTDLTSLTNSSAINALNENWDAIEEAFDNTLSLDGSTPNAMESDFDLNGNALLNVRTIDVENLTLNGQTVTDLATVPEWRSAWLTATSYAVNDLVKTSGNVYICLVAHTSGTFATDLTALKWELMVSKGDSGAGTGDMVAANNLSDLADDATARANLGLGTIAVENTVPIAKGGTGATTAADARTNLGLGAMALAANVTTSEIAAATLVTEADTIASNDNDTTIPTSAAVKAYVDGAASNRGNSGNIALSGAGPFAMTSIPSNAKFVRVFLEGASLSGTDNYVIQIGDSGGYETTNYVTYSDGANSTAGSGFFVRGVSGATTHTGLIELVKHPTTNNWTVLSGLIYSSSAGILPTVGTKLLSGTLDRIRLQASGANTFDAGNVVFEWES